MREEIYNSWVEKIKTILKKDKELPIVTLSKKLDTSLSTLHKYVELMEKDQIIKSKYFGGMRIISLK